MRPRLMFHTTLLDDSVPLRASSLFSSRAFNTADSSPNLTISHLESPINFICHETKQKPDGLSRLIFTAFPRPSSELFDSHRHLDD